MATRHLYIARHGAADVFGNLTEVGSEQARLLGQRLTNLPIDTVWHSPLPRAAESARELDIFLGGATPVREANELVDHVPYVPTTEELPASLRPFFDGFTAAEAKEGKDIADRLIARFAQAPNGKVDLHEVLVTHAYPIAWLVRDALASPAARWLGIESANAALTVIEFTPGISPNMVMFNDMSHLRADLKWTGFPFAVRP